MGINEELFERAQKTIPGGVNSPVRAFRSVGGAPRFIRKAKGAYMWDAEGKQFIDYIGSWGPMILGHNHPAVIKAVEEAVEKGLSFGAVTEGETELAEEIVKIMPNIEQVRLVSSGTEAGMSAIRLARGYTGRNGRTYRQASGIGLYLCRRICRDLGHTITASSAAGEGTVLRLDLSRRTGPLE